MSDFDLIILDLGGGEMLERCLRSVAGLRPLPARVIVFDNGSDPPSGRSIIAPASLPLFFLRSDTNVGFAEGINQAMREVRSPFVGWVNNDVVLEPGWPEALLLEMEKDAKLAAVQGIIVDPNGRVDGAGIDISDGTFRQSGYGGERVAAESAAWGVSATAAMYRVDALRDCSVDGEILRSMLFAYYEDVELCARLHEGGWQTAVIDRVLATHLGSASRRSLGRAADLLSVRNRYLVHRLHPGLGRRAALLWEDARRFLRAVIQARVAAASAIARGVAAGLFTRLDK